MKSFLKKASLLGLLLVSLPAMSAEHVIGQKDKAFVNESGGAVETITISVGDTIRFVNQDTYFHNIFSLSDLSTFDLGSFPTNEYRTVTFDKAGTIEIECAIHPEMYMEVKVQ